MHASLPCLTQTDVKPVTSSLPLEDALHHPIRWWRVVVVTSLGVSAKLLYVGPG